MDSGDGCRKIGVFLMPLHYTLKNDQDENFCVYFITLIKFNMNTSARDREVITFRYENLKFITFRYESLGK